MMKSIIFIVAALTTSPHFTLAASSYGSGSTSFDINGCESDDGALTLKHRSLRYYSTDEYVTCAKGVIACYKEVHAHEAATAVTCPNGEDLAKSLDDPVVEEERQRRLSLAVVESKRIWEGGVVCYQYNQDLPFDKFQKDAVVEAMTNIESETNVRFLPLSQCGSGDTSKYCGQCTTYIQLQHPTSGRDCNSSIGINFDGAQPLNLADRCFETESDGRKIVYGSAMHEIGHALGLYHEHQHPQRNIGVFWDDVDPGLWSELTIRDVSVGGEYDPLSIMHYPPTYGFCYPKICNSNAESECVTKTDRFCDLNEDPERDDCIDPDNAMCDDTVTEDLGQRSDLSEGDIEAINSLYPTKAWDFSQSMIN